MKLIIDIPEDEVNECKMQVDMIKQEGFLIESLNTALKIHVANGKPLEEELHREKEQAYYLGYEDGRKSEWTAVAESEEKNDTN